VEDSLCPICKQEGESVEHILWTCESARDVWAECSSKLQKCATMEATFASLFTELADRLDDDEMQMVGVVARLIWLQRNGVVFGKAYLTRGWSRFAKEKKLTEGDRITFYELNCKRRTGKRVFMIGVSRKGCIQILGSPIIN
jgi:hypothetical protein